MTDTKTYHVKIEDKIANLTYSIDASSPQEANDRASARFTKLMGHEPAKLENLGEIAWVKTPKSH